MPRSWRRWIAIVALLACIWPSIRIASAREAGWATSFDPRNRVFLSFRTVKDGPRILLFACLRDVDLFTVASEDVVGADSIGKKLTLTLANGAARYSVAGEVSHNSVIEAPAFMIDFDLDAPAERKLRNELLPVLEGKGPIRLTLGSAQRELPVSGLPAALKRFKSVCFGTQ